MKDQNAILENETPAEKRDRARSLFLESLLKPDHALRGCAHNQKCYDELMEIRDEIVEYVKEMRPKLKMSIDHRSKAFYKIRKFFN